MSNLLATNIQTVKTIKKDIDRIGTLLEGCYFEDNVKHFMYKRKCVGMVNVRTRLAKWFTVVVQDSDNSFYIGLDISKAFYFDITFASSAYKKAGTRLLASKFDLNPKAVDIDVLVDSRIKELKNLANKSFLESVKDSIKVGWAEDLTVTTKNGIYRGKYFPLFRYNFESNQTTNIINHLTYSLVNTPAKSSLEDILEYKYHTFTQELLYHALGSNVFYFIDFNDFKVDLNYSTTLGFWERLGTA